MVIDWPRDLPWRKSTKSAGDGECVEIAHSESFLLIRDSKEPEGPVLPVSIEAWRQFVNRTKLSL
jgi:Domain of unknown function (DUF397)